MGEDKDQTLYVFKFSPTAPGQKMRAHLMSLDENDVLSEYLPWACAVTMRRRAGSAAPWALGSPNTGRAKAARGARKTGTWGGAEAAVEEDDL